MLINPSEHWRWLLAGLGGLIGMMLNIQSGGLAPTPEQIKKLKQYHAQIAELIAAQEVTQNEK